MRYKSHRNLLRWFLEDRRQLPAAYVASCEKFFKELSSKHQAASAKRQALDLTRKHYSDIVSYNLKEKVNNEN